MIVIVAVIVLAVQSLGNIVRSRMQGEATRRGQEALEWIRQQRDASWNTLYTKNGSNFCLSTLSWGASTGDCTTDPGGDSCSAVTQSQFNLYRRVEVRLVPSTDHNLVDKDLDVKVCVGWKDSKGTHILDFPTRLTRWQGGK